MAKGNLQFNIGRLHNLSSAIRSKEDELKILIDKNLFFQKENDNLKKQVSVRKVELEETGKDIEKEISELKKQKEFISLEVNQLEKDYEDKKNRFSKNILSKRDELEILERANEEVEKQIKPILDAELEAFEFEKKKNEKEISGLVSNLAKLQSTLSASKREYEDLVELHKQEEIRLDEKFAELSLREAENNRFKTTLVKHARRLNKIYKMLGREDNIVINT